MINKQRVQRIRGFIYTCILLIIFVPVFMMIAVSIRTMFLLDDINEFLKKNPTFFVSEPAVAESAQGSGELPGGSVSDSAELPQMGPEPQNQNAPASQAPVQDASAPEIQGAGDVSDIFSSVADDAASPAPLAGGVEPYDVDRDADNPRTGMADYPDLLFDTAPVLLDSSDRTLFLTFDNIPAAYSGLLLDVLKKHDITATFFIGWNESADIGGSVFYKQLIADGHQVGIHLFSGEQSFSEQYSSTDAFLEDFNGIFQAIHQQTGIKPRFYRLPGGAEDQRMLSDIKEELEARGFIQYEWSSSGQDAVNPSLTKDQVLRNIQNSVQDGGQVVIQALDGTGSRSAIEALDEFISQYKANGYSFGILEYDTVPVSFR